MNYTTMLARAAINSEIPKSFVEWMRDNEHIWQGFEREAYKVIQHGFQHYSARTIVHYMRHHTNIVENSPIGFKINNNWSPYLGRLFEIAHPEHKDLFAKRAVTMPQKERETEAMLEKMGLAHD